MNSLQSIVNEYKIEKNGVEFWTPYFIAERRENVGGSPRTGYFKGRGTPSEIRTTLDEQIAVNNKSFSKPKEYRKFMNEIGLGVECSGFVYYVLGSYLKNEHSLNLAEHLYKSKKQMLEIYDNPLLTPPQNLKRSTVENYPAWVSLKKIQKDWGNNPRFIVESTTFSNEGSSIAVPMKNLRKADLIGMMGRDEIGHVVMIVKVEGSLVTYAHSGGRHGSKLTYGGVEYGTIEIIDLQAPIQNQKWSDKSIVKNHYFSAEPLRRLKVLDGKDV